MSEQDFEDTAAAVHATAENDRVDAEQPGAVDLDAMLSLVDDPEDPNGVKPAEGAAGQPEEQPGAPLDLDEDRRGHDLWDAYLAAMRASREEADMAARTYRHIAELWSRKMSPTPALTTCWPEGWTQESTMMPVDKDELAKYRSLTRKVIAQAYLVSGRYQSACDELDRTLEEMDGLDGYERWEVRQRLMGAMIK
jgi:hypothetical protein